MLSFAKNAFKKQSLDHSQNLLLFTCPIKNQGLFPLLYMMTNNNTILHLTIKTIIVLFLIYKML
jgi:hypothetical protein